MTPRIAQGANLAFEDGLELALQLSSASDLRFSFITDLLVCGKTGGFIFSTLCSFCNIRHEQSSPTSDCQCVATLSHSDLEGSCVREKQGKDNKMPWVDICRYCRLTSIRIELSGILMFVRS